MMLKNPELASPNALSRSKKAPTLFQIKQNVVWQRVSALKSSRSVNRTALNRSLENVNVFVLRTAIWSLKKPRDYPLGNTQPEHVGIQLVMCDICQFFMNSVVRA